MLERAPLLSTRVFLLTSDVGLPDYGLSAAFGVVLLILASILMWGYFRIIRTSERFRVVTGKAFRPKRVERSGGLMPSSGGRPVRAAGSAMAATAVTLIVPRRNSP